MPSELRRGMILLTWNRDDVEAWPLEDYEKDRRRVDLGKPPKVTWSVGNRVNIPAGTKCFMLVQGNKYPKGLVGFGITTCEPYKGRHWNPAKKGLTGYVEVKWAKLLPVQDVIPVSLLMKRVPEIPWMGKEKGWIQGSGYQVSEKSERKLLEVWKDQSGIEEIPEPGELSPKDYIEGGSRTIVVNRYERDPKARAACLAHHGNLCAACGFDSVKFYGPEIGQGVIHVHHVTPMSMQEKTSYKINPVKDLIPLCPNCHNAIHKTNPIPSPAQLKQKLKKK
ncbi:MAG: HNH endonuclease [Actinomycetota bacterium]